ncbi:hypothetical protein KC19_11G108300 [Ceratodon purpureus]|uniref:Helicase MAGATAMA 3 n=1 Tax=Ceratodon purpureus TaxID=3225 RepID=A0A8T0GFU1_CERPU|nr:hypothetical protein KC19_11G108300 [Ceratodon purpureus]
MAECSRREEVQWMNPKSINYTEEKVQYYFQRGAPRAKSGDDGGVASRSRSDDSVQSLYRDLMSDKLQVTEVPRIRVIRYNGSWYTFDNKRLWVFRRLIAEDIPVQIVENPTNLQLAKLHEIEEEGRVKRDGECGSREPELIDKESEKRFQGHEFMCKQDLLNRILKWSIRDLFGSRPPEEIFPIPLRHSKVESYMELLSQWLLEETRAQFQQNLLKISDMACIGVKLDQEIRSISKKSLLRRMYCVIEKDALATLKRSRQPKVYHPAASDIVLLATFAPQSPGDLYQDHECFTLGVVQGGHISGCSFEVIILAATNGSVYQEIKRGEKTWYVMKLENIVTCQRIWDSLHVPSNTPLAEYIATFQKPQCTQSVITTALNEDEEAKLQMYCKSIRRLNASQSEAVKSFVIRQLNREQSFGVELIQGPPGTGKTSTLTAMLSPTVCTNTRILVCAPTNTAVNEAARRFLVQKQQDDTESTRVHFCSDYVHSKCAASSEVRFSCTPLRLGDIVMLGSEDRVAVEGSALMAIFLPVRVKRLLAALHPDSGWKPLTQVFLIKLGEAMGSSLDEPAEERTLGHIVLQSLGRKIIAHGQVLCDDLPSRHLSIRRKNMIMAVSISTSRLLGLLSSESCDDGSTRMPERSCGQEVELRSNQDNIPSIRFQSSKDEIVISDDDDDAPQFSPNPNREQVNIEASQCYSEEFLKEYQNLLEILCSGKAEAPIFPDSAAKSFEWVEAECLESANLVFSTVSAAALRIMKLGMPFSCVIVDEAAQLVEAESTIVMQMKEIKQLVLVGDQKQLPATVMSQIAQKNGYARSLFERLQSLGHSYRLLDVQYRMHPAISAFPNKQFYNHKLKNGDNVLKENYENFAYQKGMFGPYAFIDIPDGTEVNAGSSKKNVLEAELVLHLIRRVHDSVCAEFKDPQSFRKPITVGVISPYSGQVCFIKDQLCKSDSTYNLAAGANVLDVEVRSIDGFQGKETDIIIFSAVRANQSGRIGFVDDERRMNVALTRGRHAVWILGSAATLCAYSKLWRNLVNDAKQVKCFVDATSVEWMSDIINASRRKPVYQQRDSDERPIKLWELQPKMPASPKKSGWEGEEPSMIVRPDWSSVPSLESTIPSPEAGSKRDGVLGKRASTGWDQMGFAHQDRRQQEPHLWRGGNGSSYQRHSDAENRRLYHRDQYNDTWSDGGYPSTSYQVNHDVRSGRSDGGYPSTSYQVNHDVRSGRSDGRDYPSASYQMNYDVHVLHHGWEQPPSSWQADWDCVNT